MVLRYHILLYFWYKQPLIFNCQIVAQLTYIFRVHTVVLKKKEKKKEKISPGLQSDERLRKEINRLISKVLIQLKK